MKKFKLLALALVFGTMTLSANTFTIPEEDDLNREIRTQIVQLLDTPDFNINNDMNLEITFTFNSEGEIVVLNVNSRNTKVLDYVRTHLNHKKIDTPAQRGEIFIMPFTFKMEEI